MYYNIYIVISIDEVIMVNTIYGDDVGGDDDDDAVGECVCNIHLFSRYIEDMGRLTSNREY